MKIRRNVSTRPKHAARPRARRDVRVDVLTTEAARFQIRAVADAFNMRQCEAFEWIVGRAYLQAVEAGRIKGVA